VSPSGSHEPLGLVEDLLSAFDNAGAADFVGGRLMQAGLKHRRAQLLQQYLLAAEIPSQESLDLGLAPAGRQAGAELGLLAGLLGAFQESVTAIAQSVRRRPTSRGLVPADIQALVRMRVAFALPGSLTLRLVPERSLEELPVDEGGSLLDQSVETLLAILAGVESDEQASMAAIAQAGPRAAGHLATLASVIQRNDADISFRWRSRGSVTRTGFSPTQATRLASLLREVEEEERDRVYSGRLVGGSLVRGTFELELDDGSIVSGRVGDDLLELVEVYFGQECTAAVHIRETKLPAGDTKEHVYLVELRP
jgi:hypothetical protein